MPRPKTFNATKTGTKAELRIYGDIYSSEWGGIDEKVVSEALREMGDVTQIDVRINSRGGDVYAGWAISNLLQRHPAKKTSYIDGIAASSAANIAAVADEIVMPTNSLLMFHESMMYLGGNKSVIKQRLKELEHVDAAIVANLAKRTGQSEKTVNTWIDEGTETWFSPAEAKAAGFPIRNEGEIDVTSNKVTNSLNDDWPFPSFKKAPATAVALLAASPENVADFAIGDRVQVKGAPHMPGQAAGEVRIVSGETAYGVQFDGTDAVHKWYVASELEMEEKSDNKKGMKMATLTSPTNAAPANPPAAPKNDTPAPPANPPAAPTNDTPKPLTDAEINARVEAATKLGIANELKRQQDIRALCKEANCENLADKYLGDPKFDVQFVRNELFTELCKRNPAPNNGGGSGTGNDDSDPHAAFKKEYAENKAAQPTLYNSITEEQYVRSRCREEGQPLPEKKAA